MQSLIDIRWHVFIKVSELGSLTRAAIALDFPQSLISRHIAQLEQDCGARLFRRTGRGVVLTDFGQQIYPRVRQLIGEAEVLADEIRTSGGEPIGEVHVGFLPSTVPLLAGKLFSYVREHYPKLRLHVTEGPSAQLEENVREGRLDMALLLRENDGSLCEDPVLTCMPLQLVGPKGDPVVSRPTVDFDDLAGLPLVVPSHPHLLRARLDQLAQAKNLSLNIAVEADSNRLQHEIAAAGGGYAITAGLVDGETCSALASARIVNPQLLRAIVLGTTLRRPHTLATREIYRLIVQLGPGQLQMKGV